MDAHSSRSSSSALPPMHARLPRSRSSIERAYLEGVKAISELQGVDDERRGQKAVEETRLTAALLLEVLLDVRDLMAECAWRLSDLEAHVTAEQ